MRFEPIRQEITNLYRACGRQRALHVVLPGYKMMETTALYGKIYNVSFNF